MKELADGVFAVTDYQGVNLGAVITPESTICIDVPSYPADARHWTGRLRQLSLAPIQYVILTDCHGDRILNTRWINAPILTHQWTADRLNSYDKRYPQALLDSLIARNPDCGRDLVNNPVERAALTFTGRMTIVKSSCEICLIYAPGPTAGNIWVHFPKAKVLFTGDSVVAERHPLLAEAYSEQWLSSLDALESILSDVDVVVPGRGPLCDKGAAERVADFIHQVRTRAERHYRKQQPREEIESYVAELAARYPLNGLPPEWVQRQLKLSLERVYDEIKLKSETEAKSD